MSNIPAKYDNEVNALIAAAVDAAIAELKAKHDAELLALNELLTKAREANATADYSAYEAFPDLVALLKETDLRPGALPSLCALEVWKGLTTGTEISKAIPVTPKLGDKGGVPSSPKIITSALQKLSKSLLAANKGVGVKVTSIRGKEGDCSVKKIRFQPMVEMETEDANVSAPTENVETVSESVAAE